MKKKYLFILFTLICLLPISSCNKREKYLKKAIKYDAIVCALIYSEDSAIIMVNNSSHSFIREIGNDSLIVDPAKYLFESINNGTAIRVSKRFYQAPIYSDAKMDSVYQTQGIKGLLKRYFKKSFGGFILSNAEESYPLKGHTPYPAFGEDHNVGYMAYLLSKHNIYLSYFELGEGHILSVVIADGLSDMKQLDGL